ncbi:MAG: FHA domain-containing protein [Bacteroidetes bacterium]|nr:FHA domain-containing protein [Bacteroidota bacterium]
MSKKLYLKIGSDSSNDIVIENIDRFHLELFRDKEGNVFISDLNTESGTRVNSRRLTDYTQLQENDRVYLAETIFFNWQNFIEEHDESFIKDKDFAPKSEKKGASNTKTKKQEYIEIAIIYGAILLMLFFLALRF